MITSSTTYSSILPKRVERLVPVLLSRNEGQKDIGIFLDCICCYENGERTLYCLLVALA